MAILSASCASSRGPSGRAAHTGNSRDFGLRMGILHTARRTLGIPYRFGGKTPRSGFDCSGLTGYVFRKNGYRIPFGARNQYISLRRVRYPQPGDLVFFRTAGRRISHVGIYAGRYKFIHAPRTGKTVEYADLRNRYWRRRYAGARSVF